jgi:hypothetical protein
MLQVIHQEPGTPRASSIYCRWICESRNEGERLIAVWIDTEMRCFAREFASISEPELSQRDALEEPGGVASLSSPPRTSIARFTTGLL